MHVIILLAAVALIAVIAVNMRKRDTTGVTEAGGPWSAGAAAVAEAKPASTDYAGRPVAFISNGKLFYQAPGEALRELHSTHIQGVMDRLERARANRGWRDGTSLSMSFVRRGMGEGSEQLKIQTTSAQFLSPGTILYFLRDESFGGLFEQQLADGNERRLLHKQNLSLEELRLSPEGDRLLCSQRASNGIANIAILKIDGSAFREVTGGDTADSAPSWFPGEPDQVVFQSSGIARGQHGFVLAYGPASIQMVDTAKGSLRTVLQNPKLDFLAPRVGVDGNLYFIRRPYEGSYYPPQSALMDVLMFPYRLLRAIFHYLNFFSLMYTRKPLTSADGPDAKADMKEILLKGKRLDAEAALRKGALVNGVRSLVPANWQLVRRDRQGVETVLANHVVAFDMDKDGTIVFSNGNGIFELDGGDKPKVLVRDQLIADVIMGTPAASG